MQKKKRRRKKKKKNLKKGTINIFIRENNKKCWEKFSDYFLYKIEFNRKNLARNFFNLQDR